MRRLQSALIRQSLGAGSCRCFVNRKALRVGGEARPKTGLSMNLTPKFQAHIYSHEPGPCLTFVVQGEGVRVGRGQVAGVREILQRKSRLVSMLKAG